MKTGKSGGKVKNPVIYLILLIQTIIVLFPIYTMLIIPFKKNTDIFKNPYSIPSRPVFSNFRTVWEKVDFLAFYKNSLFVTLVSLAGIVLLSSLAAYALARYNFKWKNQVYFYFIAGIMIPIRLGVLNIFSTVRSLGLFDNLFSLVFVYIAMCIPISILLITNFMKQIPMAIEESAMIDGCSKLKIYARIIMPLIKPAIATVVIYNFLPIWNDFYFPLIFIRSEQNKTIPLGVALFFGQHTTNWAVVFSALTLACLPPLLIYIAFSKYFIQGITAGAVKG